MKRSDQEIEAELRTRPVGENYEGPQSLAMPVPDIITRHEELKTQLSEARRVLKLVEWIGDDQMPHCHVCDVERWDGAGGKHGHAPDCALAKALGEGG